MGARSLIYTDVGKAYWKVVNTNRFQTKLFDKDGPDTLWSAIKESLYVKTKTVFEKFLESPGATIDLFRQIIDDASPAEIMLIKDIVKAQYRKSIPSRPLRIFAGKKESDRE